MAKIKYYIYSLAINKKKEALEKLKNKKEAEKEKENEKTNYE